MFERNKKGTVSYSADVEKAEESEPKNFLEGWERQYEGTFWLNVPNGVVLRTTGELSESLIFLPGLRFADNNLVTR